MALLAMVKGPRRLAAENIALRHQVSVLRRKHPGRVRLSRLDRIFLTWLTRLYPSVLDAIVVVRPETVLRWHRYGFRALWRRKSRNPGGRPIMDREIRVLIKVMARDNSLWGAPRIHGELLKLGFDVSQSTVSKYLERCYLSLPKTLSISLYKETVPGVDEVFERDKRINVVDDDFNGVPTQCGDGFVPRHPIHFDGPDIYIVLGV